eukprot:1393846-Amorphochlora_amoeboformis.AAC.1
MARRRDAEPRGRRICVIPIVLGAFIMAMTPIQPHFIGDALDDLETIPIGSDLTQSMEKEQAATFRFLYDRMHRDGHHDLTTFHAKLGPDPKDFYDEGRKANISQLIFPLVMKDKA